MYYIIKDYRRLLEKLEVLKAYVHKLEADLDKEKEKRYTLSHNNRMLAEKKTRERRGKRRLFEHIAYLIEKYNLPISEKPIYDSDIDEREE